jgi:DNA-binding MarR family transcriptional regulator
MNWLGRSPRGFMKSIEDSHRALRLLEEISKGEALSQRDLSDRMGVALGLVNLYLKNLVAKGHVKISAIPRKRYKYYITPKGFLEKSKLTYKLIQNYTNVFKEARKDFSVLFLSLKEAGLCGVFFAGIDDVAEIAYLSLQEANMELFGAADDAKAGEYFFRTKVLSFAEMDVTDSVHIVLTSFSRREEVYKTLAGRGIDMRRVHVIHPPFDGFRDGGGMSGRTKHTTPENI